MRSRLLDWTDAVGLLAPLMALVTLGTYAYQVTTPLDLPYDWLLPLRFWIEAVEHPYSPSLIVAAFLLGRLKARGGVQPFIDDIRQRFRPAPSAAKGGEPDPSEIPILAAINVVMALGIWWVLVPVHTVVDAALLAAGAAYLAPEARDASTPEGRRKAIELMVAGPALVIALLVVSYVFTFWKANVLRIAEPVDDWLMALQTGWFGKPLHHFLTDFGASQPGLIKLLDEVYIRIFLHVTFVAAFLAGMARHDLRNRYFTALVLAYMVGCFTYNLVPLLGPVYDDPEAFAYLLTQDLVINGVQQDLARNTADVRAGTASALYAYSYIAALPSLHMAHESIMLYYSRFSRPFFLLQGLFWLLTLAAVLLLGWHYVEDVLAGFLLAGLSIGLAEWGGDRWVPKPMRPPPEAAPQAG